MNTATITKGTVTKTGSVYNIPVDVVINDGLTDILTFSVSAKYNTTTPASTVTNTLRDKIKDQWDEYLASKAIEDSASLDTAISTMTTQLNTYIN